MLALRSGVRRQLLASLASKAASRPLLSTRRIATTTAGSTPILRSTPATSARSTPPPPIDFSDTAAAYSSLATADLVRAYLVFRACGLRPLVTHADEVLRFAYRLLGKTLTEMVVASTFFRHFCAGETAQGIRPRVERLRRAGVGGILDFAAEADVQQMASPAQAETTQAYTEGAITCRCVRALAKGGLRW